MEIPDIEERAKDNVLGDAILRICDDFEAIERTDGNEALVPHCASAAERIRALLKAVDCEAFGDPCDTGHVPTMLEISVWREGAELYVHIDVAYDTRAFEVISAYAKEASDYIGGRVIHDFVDILGPTDMRVNWLLHVYKKAFESRASMPRES